MSLLNLPGYEILTVHERQHDIYINLKPSRQNTFCRHCRSSSIRKKGVREQFYFDLPIRNKRVGLNIHVQGYLCHECGRYSQIHLPAICDDHSMTVRLLAYIQKASLQKPFTHIADTIGVSESNVRKIFKEYVEILERENRFETPRVMGMDEIHLCGRSRAVITNIEERTIIEMIKDRNKTSILSYLGSLEKAYIVMNVAIDMWKPYRDAVNEALPNAVIVIDKFHVVRLANNALEAYRKELRRTLSGKQRTDLKNDRFLLLKRRAMLSAHESFTLSYWENNYPMLARMYDLKEQFFEIYEANTKEEAYDRYAAFEAKLTNDIKPYFNDLIRAVGNWHTEIFAYFDHPVTNAYTESMNSVIRHIDRMGRSYSFETIRAKMLYSKSLHKTQKPKMEKSRSAYEIGFAKYTPYHTEEKIRNFGVDIFKLAQSFERGEFD